MDKDMPWHTYTIEEVPYGKEILKDPNPKKLYAFIMDASMDAWTCVLTQAYTHIMDGLEKIFLHTLTYMNGLFRGSQLNLAAPTKEAYAIYISIKKKSLYLDDADITLGNGHLPLWKFLEKNTLNSKVNNWAVEIETIPCYIWTY